MSAIRSQILLQNCYWFRKVVSAIKVPPRLDRNIFRQYSTLFNNIRHYSTLSDNIRHYLAISDIIREFPKRMCPGSLYTDQTKESVSKIDCKNNVRNLLKVCFEPHSQDTRPSSLGFSVYSTKKGCVKKIKSTCQVMHENLKHANSFVTLLHEIWT